MTTEFTPGPWKSNGRYVGTPNHMSYIAECRDQNGNWTDEPMARANASLIAAAPDLLAALNEVSLMWHAESIAIGCSTGDGMTSVDFDSLMQRVEVLTLPFRVPA